MRCKIIYTVEKVMMMMWSVMKQDFLGLHQLCCCLLSTSVASRTVTRTRRVGRTGGGHSLAQAANNKNHACV